SAELEELANGAGVERADPLRFGREMDPAEAGVVERPVATSLPVRRDGAAASGLVVGLSERDHLRHLRGHLLETLGAAAAEERVQVALPLLDGRARQLLADTAAPDEVLERGTGAELRREPYPLRHPV